MKRWAWLAVFLTGCVSVAPPSAVETAVMQTVQAMEKTRTAHETFRVDSFALAQATPTAPTCCCCCTVPTCVPNVAPATGPAPTGTAPVATPTRLVTPTPTRLAPVLTPLPPATLDYWEAETRYCGQWGTSMTAQDWLAAPAIPGGVNIRNGPGVNYAAVARMQDEEVFTVLRQYSPNALNTWLCVYAMRSGVEVFGWSAQLYQGTKLLDVLP